MTPGYGQKNLDIIGRVRVHFCGPLAKGIGEKAFHFIQTDEPEFSIPARPQLDRIGSTVLH